jgi:hypothetical protein
MGAHLIAYLDIIKTREDCKKQGLGSDFIAHLVGFFELQLGKNPGLVSGFILVGQSQRLKPHEFFLKQGFGPPPKQFKNIKMEDCDIACREIIKPVTTADKARQVEEEKVSVPVSIDSAAANEAMLESFKEQLQQQALSHQKQLKQLADSNAHLSKQVVMMRSSCNEIGSVTESDVSVQVS